MRRSSDLGEEKTKQNETMQTCWSKYECHVFLRQSRSFCWLADARLAYGTSPQCALKSLGGH